MIPAYVSIIFIVLLCIVTVEAISWAYAVYNHCMWHINHSDTQDRRVHTSYSTISIFSSLSGLTTFVVWCVFLFVLTLGILSQGCIIFSFGLVMLFNIMTIHTWYLIASFIAVPFEFIPIISKTLIHGLNIILGTRGKHRYIPLRQWEEIFRMAPEKKSLLLNFLDVIPDMLWVKDNDNKFVYVNNTICKDLLLLPEHAILGKTSTELANKLRKLGYVFTFGELCCDSDEITKDRNKPTLFFEYGLINGVFKAYRVLKAPVYDSKKQIIGTIGVGRDITYHIESYNTIHELFMAGKNEEGMSTFLAYKQHFESMQDIKDLDLFQVGMR